MFKKLTHFIYFKLLSFWYQPHLNRVTWILFPLSGLFYIGLFIRKILFYLKIFNSYHARVPVIIVGNITVGGTGKTPFVIWLANFLATQPGIFPGIVSRGVGGKRHKQPYWVTHTSLPEVVGDEALLLVQQTECPVVISHNRAAAVHDLLAHTHCNLIVSDDGLQHYALCRDLEIVMIDGLRAVGNQQLLPAGPLREPLSRLQIVDCLIINTSILQQDTQDFSILAKDSIANQKSSCTSFPIPIFNMLLQSQYLVSLCTPKQCIPFAAFYPKKVHAVAAIGNPEHFFSLLRAKQLELIPHVFPDHYLYQETDLNFNDGLPIVMTEKDATKCKKFAHSGYWYVPVVAVLDDVAQYHLKAILQKKVLTVH